MIDQTATATATEEIIGFETAQGQVFEAGVQGFSNSAAPFKPDPTVVNPNATRWLFNPFAYIDVSARPISGYRFFGSGGLYPIEPQNNRVSLSGISSSPGKLTNGDTGQEVGVARPDVPGSQYKNEIRTAHAIATEMESAYADRGLRIMASLTGTLSTDPVVGQLFDQLVRPGITMSHDPYFPEHPVMNMVKLDQFLRDISMRDAATLPGAGTNGTLDPIQFVKDVRESLRIAIQTARTTTNDAKRHVANKTVGYQHTFDAWATRCFLALGENTPSDLPPQYQGGAPAPELSSELAALRAENERLVQEKAMRDEVERLRMENESLSAETAATMKAPEPEPVEDKIVATCTGTTKQGAACKSTNVDPETGRCPSHPLENTGKEESTNVSTEG